MFLCLFFTLISVPRLANLIRQQKQYQYYAAGIANLEKENEMLVERIDAIKKDAYYTEKLLRDNYGYVKEGEYIYRIAE